MMLSPEERADRATVNEAARPTGSAGKFEVPRADESEFDAAEE
jgi:hypothetical protein